MSNSKAARRKDLTDIVKDIQSKQKRDSGIQRQHFSGLGSADFGSVSSSASSGGGVSSNSSQETSNGNFLPTAGGTMIGPIATFPVTTTISGGVIDVGQGTSEFTSNLIVIGAGDLDTINNPTNSGQLLWLQSHTSTAITLKHGTGNIWIYSGVDYTMTSGEAVLLLWDAPNSRWNLVGNFNDASGGSGGMNTDLSNMTSPTVPPVDLDMNDNDIVGLANIDFDGASATIQGLNTLNFWHSNGGVFNNIISVNTVGLQYYTGTTWEHQFYVGGTEVMRMGTSAIEMSAGVDMNDNSIVQVQKIEFSNDIDDNITSSVTGITYNVNSTDEHFFAVGGTVRMTVDSTKIEFDEPIDMNNNNITEVNTIQFNTSGQTLSTSATELAYQVPSSDKHGFYVAASKILDITDQGIELNLNEIINFGANAISLSASSGVLTLPGNPLGFINAKVGATSIRIPYYST